MTAMPAGLRRWQGRWERRSLQRDDGPTDDSTRVIWLQTGQLYCDLRIPAGRPALVGCHSLPDLDDGMLRRLVDQQGFAGHLEAAGDLCYWHRHIDFQPPLPTPDAARMQVSGDRAIETGLFEAYTEVWQMTEASNPDVLAAKLLLEGTAGEAALIQGFLLAQGDSFMFALDRRTPAAQRPTLLRRAFGNFERDALLAALDFEVSFGQRRQGRLPWEIRLSTLPFLEGRSLMDDAGAPHYQAIDRDLLRNRRHRWIESQRGAEFDWR